MKTMPFAAAVLLEAALISTPLRAEPASLSPDPEVVTAGAAVFQPIAFGDPSATGHHHRRSQESTTSKPVQPQEHAPQQETEEQHRQYLKRYGF